jgi:hypothetical protein
MRHVLAVMAQLHEVPVCGRSRAIDLTIPMYRQDVERFNVPSRELQRRSDRPAGHQFMPLRSFTAGHSLVYQL